MRHFAIFTVVLTVLLVSACDWEYTGGYSRSFPSRLQGTWVSTNADDFIKDYSGTLKITYNTITISGYEASWEELYNHVVDDRRPFRGFTRGADLAGYSAIETTLTSRSEEGYIYIEDFGKVYSVPYAYSRDMSVPPQEFLRFTFGDRQETLKKTSDDDAD